MSQCPDKNVLTKTFLVEGDKATAGPGNKLLWLT